MSMRLNRILSVKYLFSVIIILYNIENEKSERDARKRNHANEPSDIPLTIYYLFLGQATSRDIIHCLENNSGARGTEIIKSNCVKE